MLKEDREDELNPHVSQLPPTKQDWHALIFTAIVVAAIMWWSWP